MIGELAIVLSIAPATFSQAVNRSLDASHRMTGIAAEVVEYSRSSSGSRELKFAVSFKKPTYIVFSQTEPPTGSRDAISMATHYDGKRVTVLDRVTNEYTYRDAPSVGTVSQRLSLALQTIPDCVRVLIDDQFRSSFFKPLVGLSGWTADGDGTWRLIQRPAAKRTQTTIVKFNRYGLLERVEFEQPGKYLSWRFTYRAAGRKPTLVLPKDALKVDSFLLRKPLPMATDASAQSTLRRAVAFFDRLRSGQITIDSAGSKTKVFLSMESIREDGQSSRWSYIGRNLVAVEKAKKLSLVRTAGRLTLANHLGRAGIAMHPFSKRLLMRENPIRQMIPDASRVSSMGELTIQSVPCVILRAQSSEIDIKLTIRKSDGALVDVQTKMLDSVGRTVTTSSTQYTYSNLGKPLPKSALAVSIPSGFRRVR